MADIIIFGIVLMLGLIFYLKSWLTKKSSKTDDKMNDHNSSHD